MSFSENLQFLRSHNQITQEQLAEQLGVSRQSVSKWECGLTTPDLAMIVLLVLGRRKKKSEEETK